MDDLPKVGEKLVIVNEFGKKVLVALHNVKTTYQTDGQRPIILGDANLQPFYKAITKKFPDLSGLQQVLSPISLSFPSIFPFIFSFFFSFFFIFFSFFIFFIIFFCRGIVTKIEAEYFKKAKGTITAICQVEPGYLEVPEDKDEVVVYVATDLFNAQKNLVARVTVAWTIRRRSQKKME